MKLHELIECAGCLEVAAPTRQGQCATCGSGAVRWVVQQQVWELPIHSAMKWNGIDREILRDMGVSM